MADLLATRARLDELLRELSILSLEQDAEENPEDYWHPMDPLTGDFDEEGAPAFRNLNPHQDSSPPASTRAQASPSTAPHATAGRQDS